MRWYHYFAFLGIYTLGYVFFVFATLADGHGTFAFADLLIGWLFFAVAVMLIPHSHVKSVFITIIICAAAYYALSGTLLFIEESGNGNFERTTAFFHEAPTISILAALWYVIGQAGFWLLLLKRTGRVFRPIGNSYS